MSETVETNQLETLPAEAGTPTVPIYNAIVVELERRRQAVGISMERMSELMGTADRSYAKLLYPDTASGRRARWETMQAAVAVLFCEGFKLQIEATQDGMLSAAGTRRLIKAEAAHWDRPTRRTYMGELGSKGGRVRALRMSPERRAEVARKAAAARWQATTPSSPEA